MIGIRHRASFVSLVLLAASSFAVPVAHLTGPENISGNSTALTVAQSNPNAVLQVTAVWNPNGASSGPYNASPLGVWYRAPQWLVFNQDISPMPPAAGFNVYDAPSGWVHRADAQNISGNSTFLDPKLATPKETAAFLVTPNWNPGADSGVYNPHPIGIWFDAGSGRWAIFNQDRAAMPEGAAFNVTAVEASIHRAEGSNTQGHYTYISQGAGNSAAKLFVTQLWNPEGKGGTYNPHTVGLWYDASRRQWAIFNIDRQAMPEGAAFHVFDAGGSATTLSTLGAPDVLDASRVTATPSSPSTTLGTDLSGVDPSALQRALPFGLTNPSFEDGYRGWRTSGSGFGVEPNRGRGIPARRAVATMQLESGGIGGDYWQDLIYPIGVKGDFWASSGERPSSGGDLPRRDLHGMLVSSDFYLNNRYVSFLIAGRVGTPAATLRGSGALHNAPDAGVAIATFPSRVELRRHDPSAPGGYRPIAVAAPENEDSFRREIWDLQELGVTAEQLATGLRVQIAIVDEDSNGYVSADDFRVTDAPPPLLAGLRRDVDHPVWGFADTHAHPTNQHGFGGRTIRGDTDGPMSRALSTEMCHSTHDGALRVMGGRNHQHFAIGMVDEHVADGFPTFIGWPRFTSKMHQQMHVDWIRRAHQGGLQVLVALGVTNMFWATRGLGPGIAEGTPVDDEAVALLQVAEMARIARENSSWMEVALTPADARRIILQGKLAVVLGVEMDNFGNFKRADYAWRDRYPMPPSRPLVALPEDDAAAKRAIDAKIEEYRRAGIRQVTPLHYISGVFGGTAAFRWQFSMIQGTVVGSPYRLRDGVADNVYFHVADDFSAVQALLGNLGEIVERGTVPYATCETRSCDGFVSTVNAAGLAPAGRRLFHELMRNRMLIDVEHASLRSADEVFTLAREFNYPVLSSHTDPAALAFAPRTAGTRFGGSNDDKLGEFQTTKHNNLPHEGMLNETNIARLRDSGGTVGTLMFPFRKKSFSHPDNRVINNCDGSTKSFAQMYLYAVDRMGGRGVAISSDRGFNDFIAPRFGVWAAYSLKGEDHAYLRERMRTEQRYDQFRWPGVRYDQPLRDWHPSRFEFGEVSGEEEDVWKALAWFMANPIDPDSAAYASLPESQRVPASSDAVHSARILNYVKGLAKSTEAQLRHGDGEQTAEQAAMFCARRGIRPEDLRTFSETDINAHIRPLYNRVSQVHQLWTAMTTGTRNAPLRRRIDGSRDWDFNIDGLAHYGLLPDFLQDLRNVGVSAPQMQPLFNSAEDYIRMWEQAERSAAAVPDR